MTTTGPRLRRSERLMKLSGPHWSLNRGAVSPAFTALAVRLVSASAWIERRAAATRCGSAFASYSRRHASSWAFNDMERDRTSDAEHVVHFSFLLTCDTLLVVIWLIPRGNNDGPPRRDGSICPCRRCRLVLRRGQATAHRPTCRFQDDCAARRSARRAFATAFEASPDAPRSRVEPL